MAPYKPEIVATVAAFLPGENLGVLNVENAALGRIGTPHPERGGLVCVDCSYQRVAGGWALTLHYARSP